MPWRYAQLRDSRVLARCDDRGQLVEQGGRVEVRYRLGASKSYRAAARNLALEPDGEVLPDEACGNVAAGAGSKAGQQSGQGQAATVPEGAIVAYTDGACSGNPGPCGVGVLFQEGSEVREYSGFLGQGTNNIAELTAIQVAADAVSDPTQPVRIYTDSSYSIGVLTKNWKAKANVELVAAVKRSLARLKDVGLIYVKGHAGIPENERADQLAVAAVKGRMTAGWQKVQG